MRWTPGGLGSDIEDRRGAGGGGFGFGRGPTIGCGGAIILLVLSLLTGKNFFTMFDGSGGAPDVPAGQQAPPTSESPEERKAAEFVSFVVTDAQDTWTKVLEQETVPYRRAKLVLFRDAVQSSCGAAQSSSGPFYCPSDERVYIDLAFYDELRQRFGAQGGPFAEAYVIAHEYGHHVQHLLGTDERVGNDREGRTSGSVRLELQADCYAGVWAAHAVETGYIEDLTSADISDGLDAAAAVGDDRIQQRTTGRVDPESWTHGSSASRQQWFNTGYRDGDPRRCDTFAAGAL